jgi:prophage regulatory protein
MTTSSRFLPIINSLLRRSAIEQLTGYSRTTIYRQIKRGLFVRPVSIGGYRVAWPSNEVDAINKARIAGKSEDQIKEIVEQLHNARNAQ